jgi:hypothetical protein
MERKKNNTAFIGTGIIVLLIVLGFIYWNFNSKNIRIKASTVVVTRFYDGQDGYSLSIPNGNRSTCTWTYSGGSGRIPYLETTNASVTEKHYIRYDAGSFYDFAVNCTDDFGNQYLGVFPDN